MIRKRIFTIILLLCATFLSIWFFPIPKILRNKINERLWERKGIDNYSITVREFSIWHDQTVNMVIKNDQITDSSTICVRAPAESGNCEEFNLPPSNYTVDELFVIMKNRKPFGFRWFEIKYDPIYKIPINIQYNDPNSIDEEFFIEVIEFSVQK